MRNYFFIFVQIQLLCSLDDFQIPGKCRRVSHHITNMKFFYAFTCLSLWIKFNCQHNMILTQRKEEVIWTTKLLSSFVFNQDCITCVWDTGTLKLWNWLLSELRLPLPWPYRIQTDCSHLTQCFVPHSFLLEPVPIKCKWQKLWKGKGMKLGLYMLNSSTF